MQSGLDFWLIVRIGLSGFVGLLSFIALLIEHWPKRGVGYKPSLIPIPKHVQFLLVVVVLSSGLGIWNDVASARSEAKKEITARERFNLNVQHLSEITEDLEMANKGINNQAVQSCDQFTTNMDNLDETSRKMASVALNLNSTSRRTQAVLLNTERLTMGIDSVRAEFVLAYDYDGSETSYRILRSRLDSIGCLMMLDSSFIGYHSYDFTNEDRIDTVLPVRHILQGSALFTLEFMNSAADISYTYSRKYRRILATRVVLRRSQMEVKYEVSFALDHNYSDVSCLAISCLEGLVPEITFLPSYNVPIDWHTIPVRLTFPHGQIIDTEMVHMGQYGHVLCYRGWPLRDVTNAEKIVKRTAPWRLSEEEEN